MVSFSSNKINGTKCSLLCRIFCRIFTCSQCSAVFVIIEFICTAGPCKTVLLSHTDKIKYLHAWNALLLSVDFFFSKLTLFFSQKNLSGILFHVEFKKLTNLIQYFRV